jgi:hypothetical protein
MVKPLSLSHYAIPAKALWGIAEFSGFLGGGLTMSSIDGVYWTHPAIPDEAVQLNWSDANGVSVILSEHVRLWNRTAYYAILAFSQEWDFHISVIPIVSDDELDQPGDDE